MKAAFPVYPGVSHGDDLFDVFNMELVAKIIPNLNLKFTQL